MIAQPVPATPAPAPRWGEQTSFLQPHQAAFWVFVIVLAVTGLDFLAQQGQMITAAPTAWFVTVVLLVPNAIPVIAVIYSLDLYEREPTSILVAALLWGGTAATTLSMYTNSPLSEVIFKLTADASFTNEWAAALTAPFVEELFKGLGIVLLIAIARSELDDVLDGFVWGAMAGVGFLLVEDVFYFVRAFAETGSLGSVFQMFLIRVVGAGPYSHFLYTGLVGMGIAHAVVRLDTPRGTRLGLAAVLIAAGVGAHFLWNSPLLVGLLGQGGILDWLLYVTARGLPMLIGLVLVVRLARERERRWFATFASGFQDDGSITPDELTELGGLRSRRRALNAAGREKGSRGRQLKGQLQRQQIQLAMTFSRHPSEDHPEVVRRMAEILATRAEYAALVATPAARWAGGAAAAPAVLSAAAPVAQSAPPPVPLPAPAWAPSHLVPDGGLPAWAAPDPALAPVATLEAGLELTVADRAGDWARVVAVNGWSGWVDGRRLVGRA